MSGVMLLLLLLIVVVVDGGVDGDSEVDIVRL